MFTRRVISIITGRNQEFSGQVSKDDSVDILVTEALAPPGVARSGKLPGSLVSEEELHGRDLLPYGHSGSDNCSQKTARIFRNIWHHLFYIRMRQVEEAQSFFSLEMAQISVGPSGPRAFGQVEEARVP